MREAAIVCACVLLILPGAAPARAQSASAAQTPARAEEIAPDGAAHHERRLYVGMWTTHLKRDVIVIDNNWVIGVTAGGYFGATFLNSFGHRAFTGGIQRTIVSTQRRPIAAALGYRLGFVTGYDGRLIRIARKTPVLPLVQPFVSIDVTHVGFELSYTFVVVSVAVSYRF